MPRVNFSLPSLCWVYCPLLDSILQSLPPTVPDLEVPPLLRERFILSGYRPVGLPWRCYALSLLQLHNQTVASWSLLLAAVALMLRFTGFVFLRGGGVLGFRLQGPEGQGLSVDAASLPLMLYFLSTIAHLSCSAAARLLHCRSEETHHSVFLLQGVSTALYQYGYAISLCVYSMDATWTQSMLGKVYLPVSAVLSWLSCAAFCHTKLTLRWKSIIPRMIWYLLPMGVAFMVVVGPLFHRLSTYRWSNGPALALHCFQVALFVLSTFFFCCPVPECLAPGRYDLVGNSHQIFSVLRSLCTLVQQEALLNDFLWRRPALVRQAGEQRLLLSCVSFLCLTLCCSVTALVLRRRAGEGADGEEVFGLQRQGFR